MNKTETIGLGTFEITSGQLVISDPCYEIGIWCQAIEKAAKGTWIAEIEKSNKGSWGDRCVALRARHESIEHAADWECLTDSLGVDSGQFGFFDKSNYRNNDIPEVKDIRNPLCPDELWYSLCCDKTLEDVGAGVIPNGVVSSSGYGDGSYFVYVDRNTEGEIVSLTVKFIDDDDDEEEKEDYDEDTEDKEYYF